MLNVRHAMATMALLASISAMAQHKANIVFIGNSITAGATLADRANESPATIAANTVAQNLGDEQAIGFANVALSGSTTTDWMPGTKLFDNAIKQADKFSNEKDAALVFSICLGTNDSANDKVNGPAQSADDVTAHLKTIVDSLLARYKAAQIVLNTPIWYSENTFNSAQYLAEGQKRLKTYIPAIEKLVNSTYRMRKQTRVFLGDTEGWKTFEGNTSLFTPENGKAGVFYLHPNKRGAETLGKLWAKQLTSVVRLVKPTIVKLKDGAEMRLYPCSKGTTDKAAIVCPGGGYTTLSKESEGTQIAHWLSENGVSAAVLFYNMPNGKKDVPARDARQAVEYMRKHASELGGFTKLGIVGSSAGGHLASTIATHTDLVDFQILLYPVISMNPSITHRGSHDRLLGENPGKELEDQYSNEKRVTPKTPPALILFSADDKTVPPLTNAMAYADALMRNGVYVSLHCYPKGGHGWGFRDAFPYKAQWQNETLRFLQLLK